MSGSRARLTREGFRLAALEISAIRKRRNSFIPEPPLKK